MTTTSLEIDPRDIEAVHTVIGRRSPDVAIVLGSGLSGLADAAEEPHSLAYADLPGFPHLGEVAGHAGRLVSGGLADRDVLLFQGRVHQYQGASAADAAYPARLAAAIGCSTLVVTNAAGGVATHLLTGDVMLITDHMNLTGANPLTGWPGPQGGTPFVPMCDAYDPQLRAVAYDAAAAEDLALTEGVYAGLCGPSYETPAEVEMLRILGADAVGMSTVLEVIVARALGLRVLGFSLITNSAACEGLSHAEVLHAADRAAPDLTRLVLAILHRL